MTRIRPVEERDVPALYLAWQELRQYNAQQDGRIRPTPVSDVEFAAAVRELRARRMSASLVAEHEGEIAGFITATIEQNQPDRLPERHATVGYLYVAPGYRRQGLGRQLVQGIFAWARDQEGVSHVEMPVLANDVSAEPFWRSLGFTPFIQRLWAPLELPAS
ncbi:MAG: GNAT family N-acetyltransferase [Dehalococcoidia bacterium]|nr:GNAT family N-acetyltransferase [Dehalococcoidia bacterium]